MRLQARCDLDPVHLPFRNLDLDGAESVRAVRNRPNRCQQNPQRLRIKQLAYFSLRSLGQWTPTPF